MASPIRVRTDHRRHAQREHSAGSPRRPRQWTGGIFRLAEGPKARFADASNFHLRLVGKPTPSALPPRRHTSPASPNHARETGATRHALPTGVVEKTIEQGIAPEEQRGRVLSAPSEMTPAPAGTER
jgi:hypothetical protein